MDNVTAWHGMDKQMPEFHCRPTLFAIFWACFDYQQLAYEDMLSDDDRSSCNCRSLWHLRQRSIS